MDRLGWTVVWCGCSRPLFDLSRARARGEDPRTLSEHRRHGEELWRHLCVHMQMQHARAYCAHARAYCAHACASCWGDAGVAVLEGLAEPPPLAHYAHHLAIIAPSAGPACQAACQAATDATLGGRALSGRAHARGASKAVVAGVDPFRSERVERLDVPDARRGAFAPRLERHRQSLVEVAVV